MIARLLKTEKNDVLLLCKDGTISRATTTVLANFLSKFKEAKNFSGTDGKWSNRYGDMSLYPGETVGYVTDNERLVLHSFDVFESILSERYKMPSYISLTEYAERYDKSREFVKVLCREGRIMGAQKMGGRWMVPEDAPYPVPPRSRKPGPRKKS